MGRVFKPKYAWTKADGTRVEKITTCWYIEYSGPNGKWMRRKAGTTKEQAADALKKAEADVLSEKMGLPTRSVKDIPAKEIFERFLSSLKTRTTTGYFKRVETDIKELLKNCRIMTMKDLLPERVEVYLDTLARERNLGSTSLNSRLNSIKAMLTWAVRTRLLPYSPLDCVQSREKLDIRRVRRALEEDEIARLLVAGAAGPLRRYTRVFQNRPRKDGSFKPVEIDARDKVKLAEEGANNVLVYRLMLESGLRKSETRAVTWNDLDLKEGTITTRPYWVGNKNGKQETLPLTPGLLQALREWRLRRPGPETAKVVWITDRLLRQFDDDLVAAGLAKHVPLNKNKQPIPLDCKGLPCEKPVFWTYDKKDSAGRVIDLHALRHTFGTRLGMHPGIDPKSIQTLMRHATPTITFKLYVHPNKERLKSAVASLPSLGAAKRADEAQPNAAAAGA